MLNKGTLAAIVAALALLGFFSTSVLLVVALCILRLVAKQSTRKSGKEVKALYQNPPQRRPPAPLPRPEHTLLAVKPHVYEQIHPSSPQLPGEGTYLTASELNPGPRTRRTQHYASMKPLSPYSHLPEKDYAVSRRLQLYSNSPMPNKYANVEEPQSPAIMQGSPDNAMSPRGRDNHIYEELE